MERAIVVMAKAPIPGRAKTRLLREMGVEPEVVARLAQAFLTDVLATAREIRDGRTIVVFTPIDSAKYFALAAPGAALVPQVEGDLGARMQAAFEFAFATGAQRVVMIGTDAPQLGATTIETVFAALARAPCAIVPADDGGYCAIGLDRVSPALFADVPWSTSSVLDATLANARSAGIQIELLEREFDVDGVLDLARLTALLAERPELAPSTARELDALRRRGQ